MHEERKLKDRKSADVSSDKAMTAKEPFKKGPQCHYCGKFGHIRRNCRKFAQETTNDREKTKSVKHRANTVETKQRDSSSSDSESIGLVVRHALPVSLNAGSHDSWIVDSGATCHMCNDRRLFVEFCNLEKLLEVTLGDGYDLDAIGRGVVLLETKLPSGKTKKCKLDDVLHVPKLSYNLLSVSKISDAGKTTRFGETSCQILYDNKKLFVCCGD